MYHWRRRPVDSANLRGRSRHTLGQGNAALRICYYLQSCHFRAEAATILFSGRSIGHFSYRRKEHAIRQLPTFSFQKPLQRFHDVIIYTPIVLQYVNYFLRIDYRVDIYVPTRRIGLHAPHSYFSSRSRFPILTTSTCYRAFLAGYRKAAVAAPPRLL